MRLSSARSGLLLAGLVVSTMMGCGSDDDGNGLTPAQQHGVGAACAEDRDCYLGDEALVCLPFKGGYCGLEGCAGDVDCPAGSACVTNDDGHNYCFLLCVEKPECNYTRPVDIESNCTSKITYADNGKGSKACVPPS
jgi:hypothetical protein